MKGATLNGKLGLGRELRGGVLNAKTPPPDHRLRYGRTGMPAGTRLGAAQTGRIASVIRMG